MQVASISQAAHYAPLQRMPERAEGSGPDHDNDGDEGSAVKSAPAQGLGRLLDTTA